MPRLLKEQFGEHLADNLREDGGGVNPRAENEERLRAIPEEARAGIRSVQIARELGQQQRIEAVAKRMEAEAPKLDEVRNKISNSSVEPTTGSLTKEFGVPQEVRLSGNSQKALIYKRARTTGRESVSSPAQLYDASNLGNNEAQIVG